MTRIKVHIADDHYLIREGFVALINAVDHIEVVGQSSDGDQLLDWLKVNKVDIVILDIQMPNKDGIEVLNYLRANSIEQDVIMMSTFDNLSIIRHLLSLGAKGFLGKHEAAGLLIESIDTVFSGKIYVSKETKERVIARCLQTEEVQSIDTDHFLLQVLSAKEKEVLELIEKDYNNKEIVEELHIKESTLKTYLRRIREKYSFKNRVGNENLAFVFRIFNKLTH